MRTPIPLLAQLELSLIGGLSPGYGAGCNAFLADSVGWTSSCPLSYFRSLLSHARNIHTPVLSLLDIMSNFLLSNIWAEAPWCEIN